MCRSSVLDRKPSEAVAEGTEAVAAEIEEMLEENAINARYATRAAEATA